LALVRIWSPFPLQMTLPFIFPPFKDWEQFFIPSLDSQHWFPGRHLGHLLPQQHSLPPETAPLVRVEAAGPCWCPPDAICSCFIHFSHQGYPYLSRYSLESQAQWGPRAHFTKLPCTVHPQAPQLSQHGGAPVNQEGSQRTSSRLATLQGENQLLSKHSFGLVTGPRVPWRPHC